MKSTCKELSTYALTAENRSKEFEEKLKTVLETNRSLDTELQKASKTIVSKRKKLKT